MLAAADLDWLNTRCDALVASRGADLAPSMAWGMGARVSADGRRITVWVVREQAADLLRDVAACGEAAAVFCEPFSSRAMQFKGHDATVRAARRADQARLAEHLEHMVHEIARVGFGESFVRAAFG